MPPIPMRLPLAETCSSLNLRKCHGKTGRKSKPAQPEKQAHSNSDRRRTCVAPQEWRSLQGMPGWGALPGNLSAGKSFLCRAASTLLATGVQESPFLPGEWLHCRPALHFIGSVFLIQGCGSGLAPNAPTESTQPHLPTPSGEPLPRYALRPVFCRQHDRRKRPPACRRSSRQPGADI